MLFSRTVDGFRVWLFAVRDTGELRTGLAAGDFTATVINDDDSASATYTVAESSEKPGMYYFDIPSAFFVAHGVGVYVVGVQIDTRSGPSGPPHVRTASSDILRIYQEDFDSMAANISLREFHISIYEDVETSMLYVGAWMDEGGEPAVDLDSMTAQVLNLLGTEVYSLGAGGGGGAPEAGIFNWSKDISGLSAGAYVLRVNADRGADMWSGNRGFSKVG